MIHNTNHHILIKKLPDRPAVPVGFIVAWNSYENGYTGEIALWFPKHTVENNPEYWEKQ